MTTIHVLLTYIDTFISSRITNNVTDAVINEWNMAKIIKPAVKENACPIVDFGGLI